MNILNVLRYSPAFGGGIAQHLFALGRAAKLAGHRLFLAFEAQREWHALLERDSTVIIIPEIDRPLRSRFPRVLREICASNHIDVVHFHFCFQLPLSLATSFGRWKTPTLYHWHFPVQALNPFYHRRADLTGYMYRRFSSIAAKLTDHRVIDRHITISREITHLLIKSNWTKESKIRFLQNGVSIPVSGSSFTKVNTRSVPVIGAVALFRPEKDHITLIHAFSILCKNGLRSELWLVGDGPTRRGIEQLVNELGLTSRVRFIGMVLHPADWYRQFDIFVHSSHFEGHSLVVLEAMGFGLPIVATRISSIPETITQGVNGLLVNPKDPGDMAQALTHLLTDQSLAQQLGVAARKTVEQEHRLEKWPKRLLELYQEVIQNQAR